MMQPTSVRVVGGLAIAAFLAPGIPQLPLGGVPLTGLGVFAFVWVWVLVIVVLPKRGAGAMVAPPAPPCEGGENSAAGIEPSRRSRSGLAGDGGECNAGRIARVLAALLIAAAGLKVAAHLAAPQRGLTGTYGPLAGVDVDALVKPPASPADVAGYLDAVFDESRVPTCGRPGRPWRRTDPHLWFRDNTPSLLHDDFHLLFYTYPPTTLHPKPLYKHVPEPPSDAHRFLDYAGLRVEWRGTLDLPPGAAPRFRPDTDGWWSVSVDGVGVVSAGGPTEGRLHRAVPAAMHEPWDRAGWNTGAGGPRGVVIRYLRPQHPADAERRDLTTRFRLRWQPDGDAARVVPVPWRAMAPATTADGFGALLPAEAMHWAAVACLGAGLVLALVRWVDWRAARAGFPSDRMLLLAGSTLSFAISTAMLVRHCGRDPQYNTPDAYDYKIYLNRALVVARDGDPTPESRRPAGAGETDWDFLGIKGDKAPPPKSAIFQPPPVDEVRFAAWGPLDTVLREMARALEGRLGATAFHPDEPAVLTNRLFPFYRNPLMDWWVAGLVKLTAERMTTVYLLQAALVAALPWMVYGLGCAAFGRWVGLVAAGLTCVDVNLHRYIYFLFAENPAAFLTVLAVWTTWRAGRAGAGTACPGRAWAARCGWYAAVAIVDGLAFLMRPNLLLLAPVSVAWLLIFGGSRRGGSDGPSWLSGPAGPAGRAAAMLPAAGVFVLLWAVVPIRNHQLGGEPHWSALSGPVVLIVGSDLPMDLDLEPYVRPLPGADAATVRRWLEEVRTRCFDYRNNPEAMGDPLHPACYPAINPVLVQIWRDFAWEHPGHIVAAAGRKLLRLCGLMDPAGKFALRPELTLHMAGLVLAAVLAASAWWRRLRGRRGSAKSEVRSPTSEPDGRAPHAADPPPSPCATGESPFAGDVDPSPQLRLAKGGNELPEGWGGPTVVLLLGMAAAVIAPLVVFYFEDRHRAPLLPFVHVLGTAAVFHIAGRVLARRNDARAGPSEAPPPTPHHGEDRPCA